MVPPPLPSRATPPSSGVAPEVSLVPDDVAELVAELEAYHAVFSPLFQRREQREWALKYLQGQLLDIPRKTIAEMAWAVEGGSVQNMQQFISDAGWQWQPILEKHQEEVAKTLGHPSAALILDSTQFPKKGSTSVGVARQYCGALGKVANCQSAVVAAYASPKGCTLVDFRLYLPEAWFSRDPANQRRWQKGRIPPQTPFRTHPELAWEIVAGLLARASLPFGWVLMDEGFGRDTALLDRLAEAGLCYLAEVPHSTEVWTRRPATYVPPAKPTGRPPHRERLRPNSLRPLRVGELADTLTPRQWARHGIKEGAHGPLVADFAALRVWLVRGGLPASRAWVIFRRKPDDPHELKVYLSNAPAHTPLEVFAHYSGMRWPIETVIQEAKSELGMDHYAVRGWPGWHRHMTMCLLAHHFLVRARNRLKKTLPPLPSARRSSS